MKEKAEYGKVEAFRATPQAEKAIAEAKALLSKKEKGIKFSRSQAINSLIVRGLESLKAS